MEIVTVLVVLIGLTLAVVGATVVVCELTERADDRQRRQERTRQAEQEIAAIGRWEQEAILAALRRRTEERRPGDWPPPPSVVDGEVLHVEDEPGGSRW